MGRERSSPHADQTGFGDFFEDLFFRKIARFYQAVAAVDRVDPNIAFGADRDRGTANAARIRSCIDGHYRTRYRSVNVRRDESCGRADHLADPHRVSFFDAGRRRGADMLRQRHDGDFRQREIGDCLGFADFIFRRVNTAFAESF